MNYPAYPELAAPFDFLTRPPTTWTSQEALKLLRWVAEHAPARARNVLSYFGEAEISRGALCRIEEQVFALFNSAQFVVASARDIQATVRGHVVNIARNTRLTPEGLSLAHDLGLFIAVLLREEFDNLTWFTPTIKKKRAGEVVFEVGYHEPAISGFASGAVFPMLSRAEAMAYGMAGLDKERTVLTDLLRVFRQVATRETLLATALDASLSLKERGSATAHLARIGTKEDREVVMSLIRTGQMTDWWSVFVLKEIKDGSSRELLTQLLNSPDRAATFSARQALKGLDRGPGRQKPSLPSTERHVKCPS